MGAGAFLFSAYGSYLYASYVKTVAASRTLSVPADVTDRYDRTASGYDAEVDGAEWLMRLGHRRRELVARAKGHVLEVAVGTGRNMGFYEIGERRGVDEDGRAAVRGVRSVTFVDRSAAMVDIARQKFDRLHPNAGDRAVFLTQCTMDPIPPPPKAPVTQHDGEDFRFDAVIDTMGLCSHPDPVAFLRRLGELVARPHGRILLLEHGRSPSHAWLNKLLDDLALAHADRHGCWWNRDLDATVRKSGLEIVEAQRFHFGTTAMFVLKPV